VADWLTITGVKPYDGRYEWNIAAMDYTTREWIWIKQYAKVQPADYFDELRKLDAALVLILAAIMLRRAGKVDTVDIQSVWDRFQDVNFGSHIQIEPGDHEPEEDDADGPPPASSSSNGSSSGIDGAASSETLPVTPPVSGSPPSDTSVSVPVTSAN
jgi:hypothetical protein